MLLKHASPGSPVLPDDDDPLSAVASVVGSPVEVGGSVVGPLVLGSPVGSPEVLVDMFGGIAVVDADIIVVVPVSVSVSPSSPALPSSAHAASSRQSTKVPFMGRS
jgi:hypothetical protein